MSAIRKKEEGTTLVEVTLALGLLAGVMTSIAGLFILGAGQVRSGRTASEALAVARTIVEDIESWGFHGSYGNLGYDGTAGAYVVDTRTNYLAAAWHAAIEQKMPDGYATIAISALDPGSPELKDCSQMRVMVTVFWAEGARQRSVRLGTVRM